MSSTPLVRLLTTAALVASTAAAAATCQLCPANATMMGSSNPIPHNLFQTPVPVGTCHEIDSLLGLLPFGSQCNKTLSPFLKIFDAQYYCQCSGAASPGVCPVCSKITNTKGVFPSGRLANFTCTEANRFVASLATSTSCASSELKSFCCPAEASNATSAPGGGATNTMAPTPAGTYSSTSAGTCQICPANSTLTAGSNALPSGLFPTSSPPVASCSQLDSLLKSFRFHALCTRALSRVEKLVDIQYYCGCSGMTTAPPGVCQMCQNVTNGNAMIPKGRYANLTCLEANKFFAALPSSVTCPASYFTKVCCPSEHTASKSPSGTAGPTPAGMTMTPSMASSMTMMPSSMTTTTTTTTPAGNGTSSTMTPSSAGSTKAPTPGSPTQPITTSAAVVAASVPWSRVGSGRVLVMMTVVVGGGSLADLMMW